MSKAHKEYNRRINQPGHGGTADNTIIEETNRRILNERQFKVIRPFIEDLTRAASQSRRSETVYIADDPTAPNVDQEMHAQASRAYNGSRSGTGQHRDDQSNVSNDAETTINQDPADSNESDNYPNDDALDAAPRRSGTRHDYNSSQEKRRHDASYPTTLSLYPHSTTKKPRYSKSVSDQVLETMAEYKNEALDLDRKKLALSEKQAEQSLALMKSTGISRQNEVGPDPGNKASEKRI